MKAAILQNIIYQFTLYSLIRYFLYFNTYILFVIVCNLQEGIIHNLNKRHRNKFVGAGLRGS
jgi:hypothetical protein